jgi:Skp family chaperone for outer membrane proteins
MKTITSLLFLIGILLWVPASNADVYSWIDENGVKNFGNQPPQNATDVRVIFKEKPYDAAADQQRHDTENKEVTELIKELEEDEARQAAEDRRKAAETERDREPTQQERVQAEKERLEAKIAELEEQPLEYFGSQKNKRVRLGYYRYRLETLTQDPDKYFKQPTSFEGNVKVPDSKP